MKHISFAFLLSLGLASCGTVASGQQAAQAGSVTQIQASCFEQFKKFQQATSCIESEVAAYPDAQNDSLIQEHMLYLQSTSEKVQKGILSEADARLAALKNLNGLKTQRQQEVLQTQAMENEHNRQVAEIIKLNAPEPLKVYRTTPIPRPVNTNCQMIGSQMSCTSY